MVVPAGEDRWLLLTFDGTPWRDDVLGYGTHGDFFVMQAPQVAKGYEFTPRQPPPGI
jgi:hypothetical protein